MLTRRLFLATTGAGLAGFTGLLPAHAIEKTDLYAAAWIKNDTAGFSILDGNGALIRSIPLPGRGHDVTADAQGKWIVAFARRPGTFAVAADRSGKSAPEVFATPEGRHFFGHGVFSPDGRLLFTTENDFENAAGMIGIYDATDGFRRKGEFPSYGIDPHELLLMADGRTLCIANGGIETHPDFGRAKLNLASMEPSIVFVDTGSGELVEKHTLPADLSRLSTRHMDIGANGDVWIGCQYQGPKTDLPPLILRVRKGDGYKPVMLPDEAQTQLSNYIGSVAVNVGEGLVAVTSPHGNCAAILEAVTGKLVRLIDQTDVCGVAAQGSAFLTSSSEGNFGDARLAMSWDNHIARIPRMG